MKKLQLESVILNIAFPGFGQILNKKYLKGIFFIMLELLINTKSNFNQVIILSF
jgi:hypothetical protein